MPEHEREVDPIRTSEATTFELHSKIVALVRQQTCPAVWDDYETIESIGRPRALGSWRSGNLNDLLGSIREIQTIGTQHAPDPKFV
jgi:hypothetical protein